MTDSAILAERAALEQEVAGRTLCDELAATADSFGELPAYSDRDGTGGPWQTITWAQTREMALDLAAGLIAAGLQPGERVAMMLPNRVEHVLADYATVHAGGVPVTFYATLAPDQISYQAQDCDVRIAVLDGADQLARWGPALAAMPSLARVVVRDAAACPDGDRRFVSWADFLAAGAEQRAADPGPLASRIAMITPESPATLLYTSGTTGNPKGVVISHASIEYELQATVFAGNFMPHVRWVSYLPLAHIAERMFSLYAAVKFANHTYFCHDASTQLIGTVGEVQPTAFFGVPRVWEKIQAGIRSLMSLEQDEAKRRAAAEAMATGLEYVRASQFGSAADEELTARFAAAEEALLKPVRSLLGLGQAEVVFSAAAPLPPEVGAFFAGLGLRILDVYGMTETTGAFTANTMQAFRLGTVGRALPGVELRLADDGEILTRGPLNTVGYLNLAEQTAALIDGDGWLHTGDIGTLDADGFLSVVDRKKELIITAGGENVAPAAVENLLVEHPLIGQALAFGDRRPYVVALLTLDSEVAPGWAAARGISAGSLAELAAHPDVLAEVTAAVAEANRRLARVQQVKSWRLLPVEWTAESGELTPTLKLKRRVVHEKYADAIDTLYVGSAS
ncbi:MAG TPA: AMP-dependent synthetase/ligase [Streptosporangiaceae bacterium]|nr:AMP-dependent synthetase/ligase [Streptosporangiaceae bacterium]